MKETRLSRWAKLHEYSYRGAYRLFHDGKLPGRQLASGAIMVYVPEDPVVRPEGKTVVYARVSSSENKPNLDSQADRVCSFCAARGWVVHEIIKECGSGINDNRPKLQQLLKSKDVDRIVVEHKDRLTRMGFEYIKTLFPGEIVVINVAENDETDLMQDFVSIITSFCARLYGQRRSTRKTEKLIEELKSDD